MYTNRFLDTEQSLTDSDIKAVEATIGRSLPEQLIRHYLFANGGRPERNLFRTGEDAVVLHGVMPMRYGSALFEQVFVQHKIESPWIPDYLIPFGYDEGGEFFCISTSSDSNGAIYHFWTEFADDLDRALLYLAPSLHDFIEGLVVEDEA